jgi:Bacterial capsule synthesis protein PGA_cap
VAPKAVVASLTVLIDAGLKPVLNPGESDVEFKAQPANGDKLAYERILAPVDRFPSMLDAITSQQLRSVWSGSGTSLSFTTIYPSQDIVTELEGLLGPPGPSVKPQAPEAIGAKVWGDPMSIGIVPFEALTPRQRCIQVDGLSAVDNELVSSDFTIISNEIPFIEGCVPDNTLNNLILCSRPEYFAALELSGVDAVGLTGNHMNDFGYDNDLASLDFCKKKGVPVYGGGAIDEDARAPQILEHHGNRLALLGANQWGPEEYWPKSPKPVSGWAGPDNQGSARFDRNQMATDIQAVKPRVDLVLAEVQHTEFNAAGNYQTEPLPRRGVTC